MNLSAVPPRLTPIAENERRLIDAYAIGPRTVYERDSTICDVFERQARETPNAVAIIDADGTLSYAQVAELSAKLAQYLGVSGVQAGASIGVLCERSRFLPVIFLGILQAGCAYVPLDPTYPEERLRFIVDDAKIPLVIRDEGWTGQARLEGIRVISARDATVANAVGNDVSISRGGSSLGPAYIMYTSGSTGRPKGVVVPHRAVIRLVRGTDYFASGASETFLQFAPAAFDASTFEIWGALLNGSRLAIPKPGLLSIEDLGKTIERFGVTSMWLTASIFQRVVEAELSSFRGLRQLLTGGSAGSAQHMARFLSIYPACRLIAGYGPTENTTFSTTYQFTSVESVGTNPPIGRPIANSTAYVLDGAFQPVALGEVGELFVGGDGVALGYLNLPIETAARFLPDHLSGKPSALLYRTGDRARMRSDGIIEFLGRFDDQVKIRGYRIELGEVEAALRSQPGVRDAAVIAVENQVGEKSLESFIVPAHNASLTVDSVRDSLREVLPAFMVPSKLNLVAELPTHPSGKIDRVALANAAVELRGMPRPMEPLLKNGREAATMSRGLLTRAVSGIWCEVIGHDGTPDINTNFFDAGGDSISLLRFQSILGERLGVKMSVLDLFAHTTIAQVVKFIAAGTG